MTKIKAQFRVGSMTCLALSKKHPTAFYAGGTWYDDNYHSHYALWRSDNSGKTWKGISPALDADKAQKTVYAGTLGGSILKIRR